MQIIVRYAITLRFHQYRIGDRGRMIEIGFAVRDAESSANRQGSQRVPGMGRWMAMQHRRGVSVRIVVRFPVTRFRLHLGCDFDIVSINEVNSTMYSSFK
jgi:hypothetical protein